MKQLFEFPRVSEPVKGQGRVSTEKVYTQFRVCSEVEFCFPVCGVYFKLTLRSRT